MQKTTNYQLNQWDAEDRILREDFNQDNKKLDDAIAALRDASPLVKLRDVTLSSPQSKLEVSLSGLDLTPYRELWIFPRFSASTTAESYIDVTLNDLSEYFDSSASTHSSIVSIPIRPEAATKTSPYITLLLGGVIAASQVCTYLNGSRFSTATFSWYMASLSAEELNKIALVSFRGVMGTGSRVSVLGVRV